MWEKIDSNTSRLKVPNGWIVRTIIDISSGSPNFIHSVSIHQVFVEDEFHEWKI